MYGMKSALNLIIICFGKFYLEPDLEQYFKESKKENSFEIKKFSTAKFHIEVKYLVEEFSDTKLTQSLTIM